MGSPNKRDKKNAMQELIEKGPDSIEETNHILARVWRIILNMYDLSGGKWHQKITRYQERINKLSSRRGSANMKGNMTRRLAEEKISWGTLMRGLSILEFEKVEITFRFTRKVGYNNFDTREVTITVNNDELDDQEIEDN